MLSICFAGKLASRSVGSQVVVSLLLSGLLEDPTVDPLAPAQSRRSLVIPKQPTKLCVFSISDAFLAYVASKFVERIKVRPWTQYARM